MTGATAQVKVQAWLGAVLRPGPKARVKKLQPWGRQRLLEAWAAMERCEPVRRVPGLRLASLESTSGKGKAGGRARLVALLSTALVARVEGRLRPREARGTLFSCGGPGLGQRSSPRGWSRSGRISGCRLLSACLDASGWFKPATAVGSTARAMDRGSSTRGLLGWLLVGSVIMTTWARSLPSASGAGVGACEIGCGKWRGGSSTWGGSSSGAPGRSCREGIFSGCCARACV